MAARHLDADVLIVGGGPAGSAAAIACARGGLRVVLAERDALARERPGESLHPGIEPLLTRLGVGGRWMRAVGARHPGIWVSWGAGPPRFEPFGSDPDGPWLGYQVERSAFHDVLLATAREAGAETRRPCRVLGLAREPDGLWRAGTDGGPVRSRFVIDASGGAGWLSRRLGLRSDAYSPPLLARYGYRAGSCPARDAAPSLVGERHGWTWSTRVRPGTYAWVRLSFGRETDARPPPELAGLEPLGPVRGADVTWRRPERVAGPGWIVAGEAAAQLDPASGRGVLKAVMSGMMAAHVASAMLGGAVEGSTAAQAYEDWASQSFRSDTEALAALYGQIGRTEFGRRQPDPARTAADDAARAGVAIGG